MRVTHVYADVKQTRWKLEERVINFSGSSA